MWVRKIILFVARRAVSDLFQIMVSFKYNSQLKETGISFLLFEPVSSENCNVTPSFRPFIQGLSPCNQRLFIQAEP